MWKMPVDNSGSLEYNAHKKGDDPMTSEAQLKAVKKYKAKVKRITIDFYPTEEDLWEHINRQENKQGYIKELIRKDIKGVK